MKRSLTLLLSALVLSLAALTAPAKDRDPGQVGLSVAKLLEQGHYTRDKLDDKVSARLLDNYLENLDYTRMFFTQKEIDAFKLKYSTRLDDNILLGNLEPAVEIYTAYIKRVEERIAQVKKWVENQEKYEKAVEAGNGKAPAGTKPEFTFNTDHTIEITRQKAPWPKDEADATRLWHDRVENELLQERVNEHPLDTPVRLISRRYERTLRMVHEQEKSDMVNLFLTTLAQSYDPHSEYLSPTELENFSINMRLSLVGIGAMLKSEDGYAKIVSLVPGGPAELDGRLKVNDRINAVAQGKDEFVEVVDMKLDKVVEMIRGKKGTTVRLQVVPSNATDPSKRTVIDIVRDEIKLKEQEAKAQIIERETPKGIERLGVITLPSFYADMENARSKTAKSTTRDVLTLLNRLKKENISGLLIDLRRNGGGSLEEAINLTGLFIKDGPVVQAKDSNGQMHISQDRDSALLYDGPLVVLTSRLSASASEIFAAALQDYGRAVVVGDKKTFGKGTVQTMLEIGRLWPVPGGKSSDAGALKLTIQKFYRVAGGSTQFKGVVADVKIPSLTDREEIGEGSLRNPLAYDEVDPVKLEKWQNRFPEFIDELRSRSANRIATTTEFRFLMEDSARLKQKLADNSITINEAARRAELAADKARTEERKKDRLARKLVEPKAFEITLDNADKKDLQAVVFTKKPAPQTPDEDSPESDQNDDQPKVDPVRDEALNILQDLVAFIRSPTTASVDSK